MKSQATAQLTGVEKSVSTPSTVTDSDVSDASAAACLSVRLHGVKHWHITKTMCVC